MTTATATRGRAAIMSGMRRRMIVRAGFDPHTIGKAYNRATDPTTPPAPGNGMDPERLVIPENQAALEEMLGDSAKMQKVFAQPAAFGQFITNYARNTHARDLSIATQVKEQTEQILANWLRENQPEGVDRLDLTPRAVAATGNARNHIHNPRAMGAALDREFKNSAEYFQTIWHNANRTADMQAKMTRLRNAFSSTVPSEGGFLIPEVLRSELLAVALEQSVVRSRARVIPMETLRVPFPAIDSTSNVSSVYGGIVGYWTEEGAALTESQASFGRIVLDAKKLTAYTTVPNELLSDSISSFQMYLDQFFPEALNFYEDTAFMAGDGVGQPLGALHANNGALVVVEKEDGQTAGTIYWENVVKMYSRMLPASLNRAVWVVSHDTFSQLATMALSVGTGGSAIWLNNGVGGPPMTILGLPVVKSEKTPGILGTQGDISLVDFSYYLVGDRQVMSAMSSPHFKFGNDMTAYRIIQRVDGRPWLQSAMTPRNNGPSLSPFVQLETRS